MTRMTGGRFVAETFSGYGVTAVFFVPSILKRTLVELERVGVKRVLCHSEKAAAYMADGYGRASGGPGVVFAQSVGAANLAAAIKNAVPVSDLEKLREVESRKKPIYQEVSEAVSKILNRKDVDYTPKWIIHLVDDQGRYFFGINIWRGAIYEPFIVPDEREIFQKVLYGENPAVRTICR